MDSGSCNSRGEYQCHALSLLEDDVVQRKFRGINRRRRADNMKGIPPIHVLICNMVTFSARRQALMKALIPAATHLVPMQFASFILIMPFRMVSSL